MHTITEQDIEQLVRGFYIKVKRDDLLGPVFNDVAKVDWDQHIPLLCQFWNSVMLGKREYHGNAYSKHLEIGKIIPITEAHFARWLDLFVKEAYAILPPLAASAIQNRAMMIAESLKRGMIIEGAKNKIL